MQSVELDKDDYFGHQQTEKYLADKLMHVDVHRITEYQDSKNQSVMQTNSPFINENVEFANRDQVVRTGSQRSTQTLDRNTGSLLNVGLVSGEHGHETSGYASRQLSQKFDDGYGLDQ